MSGSYQVQNGQFGGTFLSTISLRITVNDYVSYCEIVFDASCYVTPNESTIAYFAVCIVVTMLILAAFAYVRLSLKWSK